jgi:hypothetical protein
MIVIFLKFIIYVSGGRCDYAPGAKNPSYGTDFITHVPVVVDIVKRTSRCRMFAQYMDGRRYPKIKTYDKNSVPR